MGNDEPGCVEDSAYDLLDFINMATLIKQNKTGIVVATHACVVCACDHSPAYSPCICLLISQRIWQVSLAMLVYIATSNKNYRSMSIGESGWYKVCERQTSEVLLNSTSVVISPCCCV